MSQPQNLIKSVYTERLASMIPNMLNWYEIKERKFEQISEILKDILANIEKCVGITVQQLAYINLFLKEEKHSIAKVIDSQENNALLKTFEKHKTKKIDEEKEKGLNDIQEWNPTIFQFFDSLTEANLEHKVALKKMQGSIEEVMNKFEKEEDNYKGFLKKTFKSIQRKLHDIEDNSKDQRKIMMKYHEMGKKPTKQALSVLTDLKTIHNMTIKQIAIIVLRFQQTKDFIDKIMTQEKRLAKCFKQDFTKYMISYQGLYKLSTNFMALGKIIEKVQEQQQGYKLKYFNKHILPEKTKQAVLRVITVEATDDFMLAYTFLSLTEKQVQELIQLQKNMGELSDQIVFRKWDLELAEGWLIETWTKCHGCIALDGNLVLFGDENKPIKVINVRASRVSKKEEMTAFLIEEVKGIFSKSEHEYKLRFSSLDELEEFDLYIANQIK